MTDGPQLGIGLGLFIAKSIVNAPGGRIWGENNKGKIGSTFSFTLPLSNVDVKDDQILRQPKVN
jgi:signal transduction histidine kinase